jgi:hypothetical protein
LAAALVNMPARRFLADLGVVGAPDRVARDAHTVRFLRQLDLDPREILGADVVAAVDARTSAGAVAAAQTRPERATASARPIEAHSLLPTL